MCLLACGCDEVWLMVAVVVVVVVGGELVVKAAGMLDIGASFSSLPFPSPLDARSVVETPAGLFHQHRLAIYT